MMLLDRNNSPKAWPQLFARIPDKTGRTGRLDRGAIPSTSSSLAGKTRKLFFSFFFSLTRLSFSLWFFISYTSSGRLRCAGAIFQRFFVSTGISIRAGQNRGSLSTYIAVNSGLARSLSLAVSHSGPSLFASSSSVRVAAPCVEAPDVATAHPATSTDHIRRCIHLAGRQSVGVWWASKIIPNRTVSSIYLFSVPPLIYPTTWFLSFILL